MLGSLRPIDDPFCMLKPSSSKFALEGFTEAISREMHPDWNIDFCIVEPGGVKSEFAGSSLVLSERHPAYVDPGCPYNTIANLLGNTKLKETAWGESKHCARVLFEVVASKNKRPLPLRLPLGKDAVDLILQDLEAFQNDVNGWREVAERTSTTDQVESEEYRDWVKTLGGFVSSDS